ncbi:MAG: FAD:protein FMN transferase, partial [Oscillospiraceae bacterium]
RPLTELWGFSTGEYRVPSQEEISDALLHVGPEHASVSGETITLDEGTKIDLGAIAKGYLGDKLREILVEDGVSSAMLSLGGNIVLIGSKGSRDWQVGLEIPEPDRGNGIYAVLSVSDTNVVTSGAYKRYFEEDGKTYGHIIDPSTGYPAESGLSSVTVVCESGTKADVLSTALYVMGLKKAEEFWRENGGFEAVFTDMDGNVYVTSGLEDSFKLSGDWAEGYEVIEDQG